MGKGAKGKIVNVRDADVAMFPGVDGTLMPGYMDEANKVYKDLTEAIVKDRVSRIRLEGKVPRQVENYRLTYMPPRTFIAPIPDKHSWDSTMQIQEVEDRYRGVSKYPSPEPRIQGMPEGTTYPIPKAGTEFTMSFLTFLEDPRYGVTTTANTSDPEALVNSKIYQQRIGTFWRTYLMTKVIPHMGISIQRDSTSRFGLIEHYVLEADGHYRKDANGRKLVERVVCECGGNYRRDDHGDAVCNVCGLILEGDLTVIEPDGEDVVADRANFYDDDSYSTAKVDIPSFEDVAPVVDGVVDAEVASEYIRVHNELEDARANRESSIGGASLSGSLGQRERSIAAFEAKLRGMITPASEVKAKERAHTDKQGHREAIKASRKTRKHSTHEVYEGKWYTKRTSYHTARIISAIRDLGVTNLRDILKLYPDMDSKLVYRRLEELESSGRITMTDNGKLGKGKQVTITYIGKPVVHRAPEVITAPVLLQVQYGSYQKQTINARRH